MDINFLIEKNQLLRAEIKSLRAQLASAQAKADAWLESSKNWERDCMKNLTALKQAKAEKAELVKQSRVSAIKECAKHLGSKANGYAQEYGYDDMGGLSFGSGDHAQAKMDYYSNLLELEEEILALIPKDNQEVNK